MTTEKYIKLGRTTAISSFLLGTIIFLVYFFTSLNDLLFVGYAFIFLAFLINLGILGAILLKAKKETENKENRKKLLTTSIIMLLNIPIMLFYCWIAIILLNTMRITFKNETQTILTNINIIGCGGGHIDKLDIGESKTVWVDITGDCSINIDFLSNGQKKEENVMGYVTNSMGQKINHNIGGKNEGKW